MSTNENLRSAIIAMDKLLLALRNDRASGDVHVRVPRLIDELSVACRSARELADRVGVGVDLEGDGYGTGAEGSAPINPAASNPQQEQKLNQSTTAQDPQQSRKQHVGMSVADAVMNSQKADTTSNWQNKAETDPQQEQKPTTTDPGGEPLIGNDNAPESLAEAFGRPSEPDAATSKRKVPDEPVAAEGLQQRTTADHDLSSIFDKRDLHAKEAKPEAAEEVLGDAGTHGRHSKKNENHSKHKK